MPGPDFVVTGGQQLEAIAARLKTLEDGKVIRKSLTKRLGAAVKPLVPEIRSAINEIPSKGSSGSASSSRAESNRKGDGSLRTAIARGVQQKTSLSGRNVGVRLRLDSSKLPADQKALPKLLNGPAAFRHPVYGHKVWVSQSAHPFWWKTIAPHVDEMRTEIAGVLNDIAAQIERGSSE
jgi:hypothetical protein